MPCWVPLPPKQLTKDGRIKTDPVFVDKGRRDHFHRSGDSDAVLVDEAETCGQPGTIDRLQSRRRLPPSSKPRFHKMRAHYAFIQSRGNLNLKLVIRDVKNAKNSVFDPGGGFASFRRPCFAPDGSRVYFNPASKPTTVRRLFPSIDWARTRRPSLKAASTIDPSVSPDGKSIVFVSSREGEYDLYVMDLDGGNVKRILKSPGLEARPTWSPDGKRIAFTSNRDGNYEIYVCDKDGSNLKRVTNHPERDDYAAWHPDGKRIVAVSEPETGGLICGNMRFCQSEGACK